MNKKKPGPTGPRPNSAATLFRKHIVAGKTDAQAFALVRKKFPKAKNLAWWYRWQLKSRGEL